MCIRLILLWTSRTAKTGWTLMDIMMQFLPQQVNQVKIMWLLLRRLSMTITSPADTFLSKYDLHNLEVCFTGHWTRWRGNQYEACHKKEYSLTWNLICCSVLQSGCQTESSWDNLDISWPTCFKGPPLFLDPSEPPVYSFESIVHMIPVMHRLMCFQAKAWLFSYATHSNCTKQKCNSLLLPFTRSNLTMLYNVFQLYTHIFRFVLVVIAPLPR